MFNCLLCGIPRAIFGGGKNKGPKSDMAYAHTLDHTNYGAGNQTNGD